MNLLGNLCVDLWQSHNTVGRYILQALAKGVDGVEHVGVPVRVAEPAILQCLLNVAVAPLDGQVPVGLPKLINLSEILFTKLGSLRTTLKSKFKVNQKLTSSSLRRPFFTRLAMSGKSPLRLGDVLLRLRI